jgi:hypothetical protein
LYQTSFFSVVAAVQFGFPKSAVVTEALNKFPVTGFVHVPEPTVSVVADAHESLLGIMPNPSCKQMLNTARSDVPIVQILIWQISPAIPENKVVLPTPKLGMQLAENPAVASIISIPRLAKPPVEIKAPSSR